MATHLVCLFDELHQFFLPPFRTISKCRTTATRATIRSHRINHPGLEAFCRLNFITIYFDPIRWRSIFYDIFIFIMFVAHTLFRCYRFEILVRVNIDVFKLTKLAFISPIWHETHVVLSIVSVTHAAPVNNIACLIHYSRVPELSGRLKSQTLVRNASHVGCQFLLGSDLLRRNFYHSLIQMFLFFLLVYSRWDEYGKQMNRCDP